MAKLYVGFENYSQIFLTDPDFIMGLETYLTETLIAVPVIVAFALIIAMLLNEKIACRGLFRMIFFPAYHHSQRIWVMQQLADQEAASIPMMNATMIEQLLDEYLPNILATSLTSVFNNMITLLWYAGVQILIFLAALQKIDTSLYEAAKIDGGSGWECFGRSRFRLLNL